MAETATRANTGSETTTPFAPSQDEVTRLAEECDRLRRQLHAEQDRSARLLADLDELRRRSIAKDKRAVPRTATGKQLDQQLEHALEDTFPSSDPVALQVETTGHAAG